MTAAKLAIDPLWQCICPAWTSAAPTRALRVIAPRKRPVFQCLRTPHLVRVNSRVALQNKPSRARDDRRLDAVLIPLDDTRQHGFSATSKQVDYRAESTESLYSRLRALAIDGKINECRTIAEILVEERGEKPNRSMYNALILSNVHPTQGSAWKVGELLDDLKEGGLQADSQLCHTALKVLSVHTDHLLRADILEHMEQKWIHLTEDGANDIATGLLREGLLEQALERLDKMRRNGMHIKPWLLDMTVYALCEANEISEAYRIMRQRFDSREQNLGRSLWAFLLDKASAARHHAATSLVWNNQVNQKYLNPPTGVCLNVLATAAQVADAVMATEVFTRLSRRGTVLQPIHYEQLMNAYLSATPPDLKRAITVLTIMALEKLEPSTAETRSFYLYLRGKPELLPVAFDALLELHEQDRAIPIAALNLLIECYVEQGNLSEALKIYKQLHTFVPDSERSNKTFANIETFNLLLKGCRVADPPDAEQASFLISEIQALHVKATTLTYDRLMLVFIHAGQRAINESDELMDPQAQADQGTKGAELIDRAVRYFEEMKGHGWLPRLGTIELLSVELARLGDARCWDVLQICEESAEEIDGWSKKGHWVRMKVEEAWEQSRDGELATHQVHRDAGGSLERAQNRGLGMAM